MLEYFVSPIDVDSHLWCVQIRWQQAIEDTIEVSLPNWVPGSYMIRDFSRNIVKIEAKNEQKNLEIKQKNKNTWCVKNATGIVKLCYHVYGFDLSVRGSYLDGQRGYFDGASLLMSSEAWQEQACYLKIQLPTSLCEKNWQVATSMPALSVDSALGLYEYQAENYADLIDHPVEMGHLQTTSFVVNEITHHIVVSGTTGVWDKERLSRDVQKICTAQQHFFAGQTPFSSYVFLLYVGQDIYGGLEHRSSTALMADRRSLPYSGMNQDNEDYVGLLGLFSHEYFHAWNVKSIKPQVFNPYNLQEEVYTELLWFFEGVTSYYDDLFLVQSGVISQNTYLNLLAKNISRVHQNSGRFKQSIAQSSFNAWTKFYKQDENSSNAIVSYYQKGALAALCLDAAIRERTHNQKSLADVMRALMQDYVATGNGLLEDAWLEQAQAICECHLADVYDCVVHSTQELPLVEALQTLGVNLIWQNTARSHLGAMFEQEPTQNDVVIELGAKLQKTEAALLVQVVHDGSLALSAGLASKDQIVAINGFHFSQFDDELKRAQLGDVVSLHYFRQGVLLQTEFTVAKSFNRSACLMVDSHDRLNVWLGLDL